MLENLVQASNGLSSILWGILVDAGVPVDPGYGQAVRPQASLDSGHAHRAIIDVACRFLAAPDDLHRTIHLFGDHHCLPHVVVVVAAAKSTANETIVDVSVLLGERWLISPHQASRHPASAFPRFVEQ
jgi:hypothetical protein